MDKLQKRTNKFLSRFRKSEKGFTLIELLIVIAILGVLAAVVIPNISRFTGSGAVAACKAEKQEIQVAVDGTMADVGASVIDAVATIDSTAQDVVIGGTTYNTGDFLKRTAGIKGTYSVATDGEVTATAYPGLGGAGQPALP